MILSSDSQKVLTVAALVCLTLVLPGCSRRTVQSSGPYPTELRLADQYGLAYAPLAAARLNGWFEEEMPGVKISWSTVGNATAIREAMLAGRLDGGCMGIPPYLIGRDRGMEWVAIGAVSEAQLGLTVRDPEINSLKYLPDNIRIAIPQPGSIQHILLTMAAEKVFGEAGRFDNNLISLSHPDGMNAMLSGGDVGAHFTSPPYLQREIQAGATLVLDGEAAFGGDFTFIISVLSKKIVDDYPETADAIRRVIDRGSGWLNDYPEDAAVLLAEHFRMTPEELGELLASDTLVFGGKIMGMQRFASFMFDRAYLKQELDDESLILH